MHFLRLVKSLFTSAPNIAPADARARVQSGAAVLVDVREPSEWSVGVVDQAVLLPLSDFAGARARWAPFLAKVGQREILVYCAVGGRSGRVAAALVTAGFRAANAGGFPALVSAGWRVVPAGNQ